VIFVLFVPYGIVGTWKLRGFHWRPGWERLLRLISGEEEGIADKTERN
jgi:hypothetical protein